MLILFGNNVASYERKNFKIGLVNSETTSNITAKKLTILHIYYMKTLSLPLANLVCRSILYA